MWTIDKSTLDTLKTDFRAQHPYGYTNIGPIFDKGRLSIVAREIEATIHSIPPEKDIYASFRKYKESRLDKMPTETAALVTFLNSNEFLKHLEDITGIPDLEPDPDLLGGGIHAIGKGGFLKLHTDFNWHPKLKMHRRLNLLIYLNEDWHPSWRGDIELWDEEAGNRLVALQPVMGNALIFETNDLSYHGHPDPLLCPEGVHRKSIAMYYYTRTRPSSEVRLGKSEMTNYVERPGEVFESDRARRLRHRIQLSIKKLMYKVRYRS